MSQPRRNFFFAALSFAAAFFFGCGGQDGGESPSSGKLVVVTTTTHVTAMVKAVAGDRVEVRPLMEAGVDPHLYKPTAKDVAALGKADVVFYNGLMLEGRMADVFAGAARKGVKVYAVTEKAIEGDRLLEPEEFDGHWDPHVWFDSEIWVDCIQVVQDGLTEADPAGKDAYADKAEALRKEYLAVVEWAKNRISEIPSGSRKLVTSHDAFNYFGRTFGVEVRAVQGISTATEAGSADRVAMVDYVKKQGVKAIFVETSVNPAIIEAIAEEAGVKIGGELFSDAMGKPGEMEGPEGAQYDLGTWVGMMKHNVNVLVDALK